MRRTTYSRSLSQDEFKRIWRAVESADTYYSLSALSKLSRAQDPRTRLRALFLMRKQICDGRPKGYLALARRLIGDTDNNCRWQALIVVGEYIETNPEAVWRIICRYGESSDADMRAGVATVLLEHLLEHRFEEYFPRLESRIHAGTPRLGDTLSQCALFGQAKRCSARVKSLLRRAVTV